MRNTKKIHERDFASRFCVVAQVHSRFEHLRLVPPRSVLALGLGFPCFGCIVTADELANEAGIPGFLRSGAARRPPRR